MTQPPTPPGSFRCATPTPPQRSRPGRCRPTTATCCAAPAPPTTTAGSPTPPTPAAASGPSGSPGSCTPSRRPPAASSSSRHTITDMPDGVLYVPCGDRRASVCPPCAETYRADTYQLIRAGLAGGKGVPTIRRRPTRPCSPRSPRPPSGPSTPGRSTAGPGRSRPCRMRRDLTVCPHGRRLICTARHTENHPVARPADLPGLLRPRPPRRLERLGRRTLAPHHHHPRPLAASRSNAPTGSSCASPTARSPSTSAAASSTSTPSSASTCATPPIRMRYSRHRPGSPPHDLGELVAAAVASTGFRTPDYPDTTHSWPIEWGPPARHPPDPHQLVTLTARRTSAPRPSPPTSPSTPPRPPNPPGSRSPAG